MIRQKGSFVGLFNRRLAGLAVAASLLAGPALADSVTGRLQDGYGRLSFTVSPGTKVSATTAGGVLAISFSAKTNIDPAAVTAGLPSVISGGHADADGKTLRLALTTPVKLHVSQLGSRAVVDLAPANFTGTMPDLAPLPKPEAKPVDPATLPEVKLRAGTYANFTRLVFDWDKDVPYTVFPGAGKMTIRFQALARADVSVIARFTPPWVKNAAWRIDGNAMLVEFETDSDSGYHDFRDGHHIVLDILAPKADAAAYAPPGTAKPAITVMKAGASNAQASAIADAAAKLNPAKPPLKDDKAAAKPADDKTAAKMADAKPDVPPAPPPPDAPDAQAQRTPTGALLTFRNAAAAPAAVFVRGLTAWIVLQNSANLNTDALKASLKDFAAGIEAASAPGQSILRVTLKQPAQIAARASGPDLKVEIAAKLADMPAPIGFARNQMDARRASLTTLLPSADRMLALADPATGDTLMVVPAQAGHAMTAQRNYADFIALPSAAGLVVKPLADDLSVRVAQGRITIARTNGLDLTPPQMPVSQSPAALAHLGDGPSFMDFSGWGVARAGSFLATERKLTQDIAKAPAPLVNKARLALARFYLAHQFAAEALGLINMVQTADPSLKGDIHLTTMRAVADTMMGRYRDAHNEIAGPSFDGDRHAALWRGLIDAHLEDWKTAYGELDSAEGVLKRYPAEWQAKARIAEAESGLGLGRLDLADAALSRLPANLDPALKRQADLMQARLMAQENRGPEATRLFAALEQSGDESVAAPAIYYHVTSALAANQISRAQAIDALEKLRFRWRGDGLEMKTLRKLASLYFAGSQWHDGLRILHVATRSFSGSEDARQAQDDMRGAFVDLFLKGKADKMAPVDSLALFYDNLDLTPIGPDGDEMIRRMTDRLVAVDLLGPAANLLAYQVDKRLDGIAKAQVSGKLAAIYLMDHKPELAVAAIRNSDITGLPDTVLHDRMLMEARAFAALKQWDNALDLIGADEAEDTRRLRADIYWESGNWAVAGQKAEELLEARWSDAAPLNDADRAQVLRAAVAYSLANDETSLDRLRDHYAPKMKASPDANIFAVLSQNIDLHGLAFRDAARTIASVDTLQTFMKDFVARKSTIAAKS
jgi:hypothetical protein